jgi:hypothetical protein
MIGRSAICCSGSDGRVGSRVGGECDASTLDELDEALHASVSNYRGRSSSTSQTTFIDSLTLGSPTAAAKEVRAPEGWVFGVARARAPEVRRPFDMTDLDDKYLLGGVN